MTRIWLAGLLALGIWLVCAYGQSRPVALDGNAPPTEFSAGRAEAALGRILDHQLPHPAGSPENAAVRGRLVAELAAMGVKARTQTAMSCFSEPRWRAVECGTVTNVVAPVVPGQGKHVLLLSHYDSVPAGPGASDDGSGMASALESIRALKARHLGGSHPITALFTDGEESGLLGAAAWLRDPANWAMTGIAINLEARGNQGPSLMFQTSPGDARLVDIYARSLTHYASSSLYAEIYKRLPNDTDLTLFLQHGLAGVNFAIFADVAQYHTPLDNIADLEPASLQQHGDTMLALSDAFSRVDPASLQGGGDAIYLDVLGRWLPRFPASWGLPLSILAFVLVALAGTMAPRNWRAPGRPIVAAFMPPLLLAGCVGMGFGLHMLTALVSGHADPSFAMPVYLRWSLAFGVWAVALVVTPWAGAVACWLWLSGLAIVSAVFVPGLTPYFLFPSLIAGPLLLLTLHGGRGPALFIAALVGLIVWLQITVQGEAIMGLKLHLLFTACAGFALISLLPLMAGQGRSHWISAALSLVLALGLAVTAGLMPAYSAAAPQRVNIEYLEQDGKAWWLADPFWEKASGAVDLPPRLRAAAPFSATPSHLEEAGYAAPAGAALFAAPAAIVTRAGDLVTLDIKAGGQAVALEIPKAAGLESVTVGGVTTPVAADHGFYIACSTPDCAQARISLKMTSRAPVTLLLEDIRPGLPSGGARLQAARPPEAVASQVGDRTILVGRIAVPAG